MALQYSGTLRDNQLNQIEASLGSSAILDILTGSPPANCSTTDSGTKLASLTLPADYMNGASGGSVSKSAGAWTGTAITGGTAGYFRMKNTAGTVCHVQGTVGTSSADMIVDNVSFATSQSFTVNSFTVSAGNA